MPPRRAGMRAPELLTVAAAAELLSVSPRTVHNWIDDDRIPYLMLPGTKPTYRIPLHALLATLRGNYDLAADLERTHQGSSMPLAEPIADDLSSPEHKPESVR